MQPGTMKQRLSVCHQQFHNTVLGAMLSTEKVLGIYSDCGKLLQDPISKTHAIFSKCSVCFLG